MRREEEERIRKLEDIDHFLGKNTTNALIGGAEAEIPSNVMNLDSISAKLMSNKSKAAATIRQKAPGFNVTQNAN